MQGWGIAQWQNAYLWGPRFTSLVPKPKNKNKRKRNTKNALEAISSKLENTNIQLGINSIGSLNKEKDQKTL